MRVASFLRLFCDLCRESPRVQASMLEQRPRAFLARVPLLPQRRKPRRPVAGTWPLVMYRRSGPRKVGRGEKNFSAGDRAGVERAVARPVGTEVDRAPRQRQAEARAAA